MLNALWTLLHTPVVSIPAGDGPNGLPLAVQLIGFRHADGALLAAAEAVAKVVDPWCGRVRVPRSEEHTSELQSLMRISYAVFCLKKKIKPMIIDQSS